MLSRLADRNFEKVCFVSLLDFNSLYEMSNDACEELLLLVTAMTCEMFRLSPGRPNGQVLRGVSHIRHACS